MRDEIREDEDQGLGQNFLKGIFWKNKGEDDEIREDGDEGLQEEDEDFVWKEKMKELI